MFSYNLEWYFLFFLWNKESNRTVSGRWCWCISFILMCFENKRAKHWVLSTPKKTTKNKNTSIIIVLVSSVTGYCLFSSLLKVLCRSKLMSFPFKFYFYYYCYSFYVCNKSRKRKTKRREIHFFFSSVYVVYIEKIKWTSYIFILQKKKSSILLFTFW